MSLENPPLEQKWAFDAVLEPVIDTVRSSKYFGTVTPTHLPIASLLAEFIRDAVAVLVTVEDEPRVDERKTTG